MCGIAGSFSLHNDNRWFLESAIEIMKYRGPDNTSKHVSPPFFGGMCRLSINDLEHGDQPLWNTNKDILVFYNGEIYNSPKLRRTLQNEGIYFESESDGAVLPFLYQKYGKSFIEHLDGMYAICVWDMRNETMLLARDIQGEKPLYLSTANNEVLFSSSLESFTNSPRVTLSLNKQAIWDFPTFLWIPQPETIYNEVKSLLPGEILEINKDGIKSSRIEISKQETATYSDEEAIKEIQTRVTESVESQLLSDVPVGSFLSGGLDSSIVTTIASKKLKGLHTFTIGFEDVACPYHGHADESVQAESYAKELGTIHTTIRVTGDTFKEQLRKFIRTSGQPFAVSSGLGIMSISQKASEMGVKVLLTGDGADELFGGYSWYRNFSFDSTKGAEASSDFSMQRRSMEDGSVINQIKKLKPEYQAWAWHYYASEKDKSSLFSENFRGMKSSLRHFEDVGSNWKSERSFIENDRRLYLVNEMLQKADMMNMANSVEGRLPFVSKGVQQIARSLTNDQLVRNGVLKWALRKAFEDKLPRSIFNRPKHGFNVPIDHWLEDSWKDLVEHTFSNSSQLFKYDIIDNRAHRTAVEMIQDKKKINGHSIFCYIMLNMWLEERYSRRN